MSIPSFQILLLSFSFLSQTYLDDFDVGPLSPSAYLVFFLLVGCGCNAATRHVPIFRTKEAYSLFLIYVIFIFWAIVNKLYNEESVNVVLYQIASTHVFALAGFVVSQYLLKRKEDCVFLAGFMVMTALFSGIIGVFQWLGFDWAWNLTRLVRPVPEAAELLDRYFAAGGGRINGLFLVPHNLVYHLFAFGFFILPWTVSKKGLKTFLGGAALMIIAMVVFLSQFRVALLVPVIILPLFWGLRWIRRKYSVGGSSMFPLLLLVVAGLLAFVTIQKIESQIDNSESGFGRYSLDRVERTEDPVREGTMMLALRFGLKNLFPGGGEEEFRKEYRISSDERLSNRPITPHNVFLNAFVFYGLPGLSLLILIVNRIFKICVRAVRLTEGSPDYGWVCFGASLGILSHFLISLFQNGGLTDGATVPWWLLGILCAAIAQFESFATKARVVQAKINRNKTQYFAPPRTS